MDRHMMFFAALAATVLLFCILTAWARREKLIRWGVILCGLATLSGAYFVFVDLLSRPRSATEEWFHQNAKEALVTGVYVHEGVALYLYLVLPDLTEPRSYKFPWNDETRELAQSIQGALESEEGQNGVIIPYPFQPSEEREKPLTAHPLPQPKPPTKRQPEPPMEFRAIAYQEYAEGLTCKTEEAALSIFEMLPRSLPGTEDLIWLLIEAKLCTYVEWMQMNTDPYASVELPTFAVDFYERDGVYYVKER